MAHNGDTLRAVFTLVYTVNAAYKGAGALLRVLDLPLAGSSHIRYLTYSACRFICPPPCVPREAICGINFSEENPSVPKRFCPVH